MAAGEALRILVAGAGLGGLTAAIALRQSGAEVTVLERAQDLSTVQVGGGIHLWPNGLRPLAALGLLDRVREMVGPSGVMSAAEFRTWRDRRIVGFSLAEEEYGLPSLAVVRRDLHALLADALGADSIRTGAAVEGFDEDADAVTVRVAGGGVERCSALVGADGLQSSVRRIQLADGDPRYKGYTTWAAIADFDHPAVLPGMFRVYFGPGLRFVYYPVRRGRVYWEVIKGTPAGGRDPEKDRAAAVAEFFPEWPRPIVELIQATPDAAITRSDVYDRPPAQRWSSQRVTLLGDAAHPMTNAIGQGANQAIEDGVVLGRCIGRGDLSAALAEYERLRLPRTTTIVKVSHTLARLALIRRRPLVAVRHGLMRAVSPILLAQIKKNVAYDAGAV
jgi:2-polyprenyl-6-methoxyphenol hydroxylase-like FAD-dependent oxidoreductase